MLRSSFFFSAIRCKGQDEQRVANKEINYRRLVGAEAMEGPGDHTNRDWAGLLALGKNGSQYALSSSL